MIEKTASLARMLPEAASPSFLNRHSPVKLVFEAALKEQQHMLEVWAEAEAAGESGVLAAVVKTRGSSYRLPGARLLLTSGGKRAGSISGGCLEDDLVKKAWWLTESGPVIRRYDTTPEGEISTEFGLGCNGIIHVLLERIGSGSAVALEAMKDVRARRRPAAIAHLIGPTSAVGQRLVIDAAGQVRHNLIDSSLAQALEEQAGAVRAGQKSQMLHVAGAEVFIETISPPVRLMVFGAGDDAVPLTALAKYLGWQVWVFDGRAHYARRDKFPSADEVFVRSAGHSGAAVDAWTVAVLMSHSYSQDLETLREFAPESLPYLGVLGPRKRTSRLLADAGLDDARIGLGLHAPMGLDIGADGPEQVALAVVAEIQATLNRRAGGSLRDRSGSIHAPEDGSDDHALRPGSGDEENSWAPSIACA